MQRAYLYDKTITHTRVHTREMNIYVKPMTSSVYYLHADINSYSGIKLNTNNLSSIYLYNKSFIIHVKYRPVESVNTDQNSENESKPCCRGTETVIASSRNNAEKQISAVDRDIVKGGPRWGANSETICQLIVINYRQVCTDMSLVHLQSGGRLLMAKYTRRVALDSVTCFGTSFRTVFIYHKNKFTCM